MWVCLWDLLNVNNLESNFGLYIYMYIQLYFYEDIKI